MIQAAKYRSKFVKRVQLAHETYANYFEKPQGFDWMAGQYLRWTIPSEDSDDRGTSRYFTNSSSPTEEYLSITTNRGRSTFKNDLFSLESGDELDFFGPLGSLFITDKDKDSKIMLAGGIGMTPFRSIIKYASDKDLNVPLTLFVSFSLEREVIYYKELKEIEKIKPNIKVVYSLTKEKKQGFEYGRISSELISKHLSSYDNSTFFIVGPLAMSDAIATLVEEMGVDGEKIVRENFTGY